MNFCPACGAPVESRQPPGDDRPRHVCTRCGAVHYLNPKVVVGCFIEHETRLLLCRRSIEPARGLWTPPAGYLEVGESVLEGALRETHEEARARARDLAPHATLDIPHIAQTYVLFRGHLEGEAFGAGEESEEVRLFGFDALPWSELAFPVVHFALELLVEDQRRGAHRYHLGTVRKIGTGDRFDAAQYRLDDHLALPIARTGGGGE